MSAKGKLSSAKLGLGMPAAPWVFINNSIDDSNAYADALCSLIPHSHVYQVPQSSATSCKGLDPNATTIWVNSSTDAKDVAYTTRDYQAKALKRGCNLVSISLCNDSTINQFSAATRLEWPANRFVTNVGGATSKEVAQRILKWLFTAFSVRETLHLIPEAEMLAIDTKSYADYQYCALRDARLQRKNDKLQFVALVSSKPELTKPNILSWRVVDRSGEAKFYFTHRGPSSQHTWDWVLSLKPGDRKVLPRMPMVVLHEPVGKKIMLSPFRATGATIRGVGNMTIAVGKGVHWIGDKVSMRRSEEQKYMPEAEWKQKEALRKVKEERKSTEKKVKKGWAGFKAFKGANTNTKTTERGSKRSSLNFTIFNEKGQKTWEDMEDDSASTIAPSTVSVSVTGEKVEKEFC